VYVLTLGRSLKIALQVHKGHEIRHPVLAEGGSVLAAGEIEIAHGGDQKVVLELTNKSGHYEPPAATLDLVVSHLEALGYDVPADVVQPYQGFSYG
jgi:hypothetical protein